jgi:hypothetical protein
MNSIPANKLVAVQPGVLGTGGSPLSLNALWATDATYPPIGSVYVAPSLLAVQNTYGVESQQALMAAVYYSGFANCSRLPGALYFAQYNVNAVAGYLLSGSFAGVPLATLQALSGTLILSIDGRTVTTPSINLASATSYSNAASIIQAGIQGSGALFTGTASITSDVMTVTAVTNGSLHVGDIVHSGANSAAITSFGTGTGGTGTYNLGTIADASSGAVTVNGPAATVSFNTLLQAFEVLSPTTGSTSAVGFATGTLSAGVKFTSATGAVLSPGAAPTTPQAWLNQAASQTLNFATIATTFQPDITTQVAFAAAVNTSSPAGAERFMYVGETTDVTLGAGPAPSSFPGQTAAFNGRAAVYSDPAKDAYGKLAAFGCGATASINWAAKGGRITFAFRRNSLLVPSVVDETFSDNLDLNNTNYYGAFATANQIFQQFQEGQISGDWDWMDEYVNQIYLNSQFQVALMNFMQDINAVSYTDPGYALIRSAMLAPINEAVNNGTIVSGVRLSPAQQAALAQAAGTPDIVPALFSQGWYLQILDPGAQARGNRTSPNMTFWYTDGGAVQKLNLASIDVQ